MITVIPIVDSKIKKFPTKKFHNLICLEPFRSIEISIDGDVRMCSCSGWMPTTIGNIFKNTIKELLESKLAQDIRQSILNGTYEYCNDRKCGVIASDQLIDQSQCAQHVISDPVSFLSPVDITIAGDYTCNLSCPSCRTGIVKNTQDSIQTQKQLGKILTKNLFSQASDRHMLLKLSTSGEIFASHILLEFLNQLPIKNFPNLQLIVQTNGILAEKNWKKLGDCASRVSNVTVTIDAAQGSTYEKLRRGGTWNQLLAAMRFFESKKSNSSITLTTRMVLQKDNYQEAVDFYDFSKKFGADTVEYSRIINWYTYPNNEFDHIDVFNPAHPEYQAAVDQISQLKSYPDVMIYNDI